MNYYCTYFDKNFLPQGLSLYESLKKTSKNNFTLFILTLDDMTNGILKSMSLDNMILLTEDQLLKNDHRLAKVKNDRSRMEYYYCFTANLLIYILNNYQNVDSISYIDADMFFFLSLEELLKEYENFDILLVPHNISDISHGKYNVCFNYFKNNKNGHAALNWWANKTLESTTLGDGNWGDQKYLDEFPKLFHKVGVIEHYGFAAAPWNIMSYNISLKDSSFHINKEPLICYHFARLLVINEHFILPIKRTYLSKRVLQNVYLPYMIKLQECIKIIKKNDGDFKVSYTKKNLKALIISIIIGRLFYVKNNKIHRIGINLPIAYK